VTYEVARGTAKPKTGALGPRDLPSQKRGPRIPHITKTQRTSRLFESDLRSTFAATLESVKRMQESPEVADFQAGEIQTQSFPVSRPALEAVGSPATVKAFRSQSGRYILNFQLTQISPGAVNVTVTPLVVADLEVGNQLGGMAIPSSGSLERTHLDLIAKFLGQT
jgi:hypothetical protein